MEKVSDGSNLVNDSGSQLDEIVNAVKKVSDLISEIAAASQQQSAGIVQVNQAVTDMDQGNQQNAAMVEEASAAADSMQQQSNSLLELTRQFAINDGSATGVAVGAAVGRAMVAPGGLAAPAHRTHRGQRDRAATAPLGAPYEVGHEASDDDAWREF